MFKIIVRYESGTEGEFGPFPSHNMAAQVLAILAAKPGVISARLDEAKVIA